MRCAKATTRIEFRGDTRSSRAKIEWFCNFKGRLRSCSVDVRSFHRAHDVNSDTEPPGAKSKSELSIDIDVR
jgi:hypothetical protein